jgi:UDP-2,3-diacylglucosamine hydrolase
LSGAARVLGTRIVDLEPAGAGETLLLLSDLHLSPHTPDIREWLARTLATARRNGIARAVILGDLFDFWVGPKQASLPGYADVLDILRAATRSGMDVTLLQGNRDFMLERRFGELALVRVAGGGAAIVSGGRRFVLLHGDETCLNDVAHQRTRPLLRSWVTRSLLRVLPLAAAMRLGGAARRASRRGEAPTHERFLPVREAIASCFAAGFEGLVLGHIHRGAAGMFAGDTGSGRYWVLPAFDATGVSALLADGEVRFQDPDGAPLPPFPAIDFPPLRAAARKRMR